MDLVAGLDLGTSAAKLVLVDRDGHTVARAESAYPTAGGVEQDPRDWWRAACEVVAATGLGGRVAAIGLTGQMQDLVPVRGAEPTRAAILYSDTRAGGEATRLREAFPDWEERTGNQQDASSVAAKVLWLAEHEPGSLADARLLLGAPGFVGLRATGTAGCDVTTASTTGLLDVNRRGWAGDIASVAGISVSQLPRLCGNEPGDQLLGGLTDAAAAELGLPAGIPVVHAMGDAGATTDGLVGSDPGDAYLYLGTSGWLAAVVPSDGAPPGPMHSLVMPGWENRLRIAAVQSAGASADWSRRTFFPGSTFPEVESLVADRVLWPGARPLCLPGLAGERSPVRDGSFRGAFVGATDATTAADLHLAVLTGVAMALRHAADEIGLAQERIALVGGGAASAAWRQVLADVFEAAVVTGDAAEPAAHSAARAAGRQLDLDIAPLLGGDRAASVTRPSSVHQAYRAQLGMHRSLYDALADTFHRLAAPEPRRDPQ